MKSYFLKPVGRFQAKSLPFLAGLLLFPFVATATDSGYTNYATIYGISPPQVDATNFVNYGTWEIGSVKPYTTRHTLNYINEGFMWGEVGWEFDYGPLPGNGGRTMSSTSPNAPMSSSFLNDYGATIQAADVSIANPYTFGNGNISYPVSYLWIAATNVVNNGTLIGDGGGEIRLTGMNMDLFLGTLEIDAFSRGGSGNGNTTFSASRAIYDEYWGQTNVVAYPGTTPYVMDSSTIWNGLTALSPTFSVNATCGTSNLIEQISVNPTIQADSVCMTNIPLDITNIFYTNSDGSPGVAPVSLPARIFRQAVFVAVNGANITAADRFAANSGNLTNLFNTITVKFTSASLGDSLYLEDTMASLTNRGLLTNETSLTVLDPTTSCVGPTFRPANYNLSGADPGTFSSGSPGVGTPTNNFLYSTGDPVTNTDFTNMVVQAAYAGYSAYTDDLIRGASGGGVTNLPGRIVISATNLDLSWAMLSSVGAEITVDAANFIGSTGAVVSCQNLSYNLGSATGNLNVTNLANNSAVPALFNGTIDAFSALWTNGYATLITNYIPVATNWTETNITGCPLACVTNIVSFSGTNWVLSMITNITEMDLHVLLVDATGLSVTKQIVVQDLVLHSTNMLVSDSMDVLSTLLFDGQSLTLQGTLTLDSSGNLQNWTYANAPTLRYFTNNGVLSIPVNGYFGSDGPTNYAAFVNNGTISAASETIDSDYFQGGGTISGTGGFSVITSSGNVGNGNITSGQNADFYAGVLKLNNSTITASRLNFNVTGSLYDSLYGSAYGVGSSSTNTLACSHGFSLPIKPATGDLLGTTIKSTVSTRTVVDHVWAAANLGPVPAGFTNNVAVGKLVLSSSASPPPAPFRFSGADPTNAYALYVDFLDLTQLGNSYSNMLQFDPNFVLYYAAATNNYTPPVNGDGVAQEWEEYLNGQFGGHLLWVTNFAGPNSSVAVLIGGQSYLVNKALRYSKIIDSNGNGTPNHDDLNPFNTNVTPMALKVSLVTQTTGQSSPMSLVQTSQLSPTILALSWLAAANTIYQVEFATNFPPVWQSLLAYTNNTLTNQTVTVLDTNAPAGAPRRFYRVSHP